MASLAERVQKGDVRAASRLMRELEDERLSAADEMGALFPAKKNSYVIGITGSPGAGKSTLTDRLIAHYRASQKTVGVLAVDPTSPFTGGAILGDRIRMQAHASDADVFIRSMATRGQLGGLSRATVDCIRVMEALGKDVILVETVGVGQDEIDIVKAAHTTVVLAVPGLGDEVQAIKAGILEIADVLAVNKADLPGAERVARDLRQMLELRPERGGWEPKLVSVSSVSGQGISELASAIEAHRAHLLSTGEWHARERARARAHLVSLLTERLLRDAVERLERERGRLDDIAAEIVEKRANPYVLAKEILANWGGGAHG